MSEKESQCFISYSHEDKGFAEKLERELKAHGFTLWRDESRIEPGSEWTDDIEEALNVCSTVIVVLSPAALDSPWVKNEILFATKLRKKIITVIIEKCRMPVWLISTHALYFTDNNDSAWNKLASAIEKGQAPKPPCFLEDMEEFLARASPKVTRSFMTSFTGSHLKGWIGSLIFSPKIFRSGFVLYTLPGLVIVAIFYLSLLIVPFEPSLPADEAAFELLGFAAFLGVWYVVGLVS